MTKKPKLVYGIKGKLVSAVAMLLVAMIMVVSSTYAWFTLSTAPEVTGIQTAVGANGALEMLLATYDYEKTKWVYNNDVLPTGATQAVKNTYWGNLVDVSDNATYGLDEIVLLPSTLAKLVDSNKLNLVGSLLMTPKYGADGRVTGLEANTSTGTFVSDAESDAYGKFVEAEKEVYGVRAVGVSSGMTARQIAYRNAQAYAITYAKTALGKAKTSLNTNGSTLATIAMDAAMGSNTKLLTEADITALKAMVTDLTAAVEAIDNAYCQLILAYAASSNNGSTDDATWEAVETAIKGGATFATLMGNDTYASYVPETFAAELTTLTKTKGDVATATTATNALALGTSTVADAKTAINKLANTEYITINGFTSSQVKDNIGDIASSAMSSGGITMEMTSGAGVYADIADFCGGYTAPVKIEAITYQPEGGTAITMKNITATMKATPTITPRLPAHSLAVEKIGAPAASADAVNPFTEFYGFIVDLAFRTNASSSNLLLQQEGADRIYSDNNNVATQGGGSNMIFEKTSNDLSDAAVVNLMGAIRIVFYNTENGEIYSYAALDTTDLQTSVAGGTPITEFKADVVLTDVDGTALESQIITALQQNTEKLVSALVYLDGKKITNADVAYNGASSVTGSLNLQFASDANLVPMDYAGLHTPGGVEVESGT